MGIGVDKGGRIGEFGRLASAVQAETKGATAARRQRRELGTAARRQRRELGSAARQQRRELGEMGSIVNKGKRWIKMRGKE